MRKTSKLFILVAIAITTLMSCDKDDPNALLTLTSLTSGDKDLYGATSATGVTVGSPIVATFSTEIDETTVLSSVSILRGTTVVAYTYTLAGKVLTITPTGGLITGTGYSMSIAATLKSTQGEAITAVSVTFTTEGVGIDTPPQKASQVLYLQFNGEIVDIVGTHTNPYTKVSYTTDRFGTANGAANFAGAATAGTGDIVEIAGANLINPSTTISVWFKIASADYTDGKTMFGLAAERGYFMELGGGLGWCKFATSHKLTPDPNSHYFGTAWTDPNGDGNVGGQTLYDYLGSLSDILGNKWTQLVMTVDGTTAIKTIFLDGVKIMQVDLDLDATEWYLKELALADKADATGDAITGIDPVLSLGFMCSKANTATGWANYATATNTFKGAMDDFRIFNKALTENEVLTLFNSEKQ